MSLTSQWTINGKKIPSSQFAAEATKAVMNQAEKKFQQRVADLVCDKHQRRPELKIVNDKIEIKGCCGELVERAKKRVTS